MQFKKCAPEMLHYPNCCIALHRNESISKLTKKVGQSRKNLIAIFSAIAKGGIDPPNLFSCAAKYYNPDAYCVFSFAMGSIGDGSYIGHDYSVIYLQIGGLKLSRVKIVNHELVVCYCLLSSSTINA